MTDLEILKNILMSDNVEESIRENEAIIFDIIPGLKNEKGFDQKNKWHIYDVWEHTIKAISRSKKDFVVRLVLLLHDIGKPFCYQDNDNERHFNGHAAESEKLSFHILEELGINDTELDDMLFLIGSHSTLINIAEVEDYNIDLYNKLLDIQISDASAYNPIYSEIVLERLNNLKFQLMNKNNIIKRV